ncbi:hypothetical protein SAMN05444007_11617 [Cribrihabitans marinus]|uniref:Secreted protein n=1 Tax=Cribrihabitans marinus TaxID=1227549 RepID=A0A1H7DXC7_9RHOB|nr:hypothetical protein [Cribrihabitans marinus]GGH41020.1 hypothetical protein GCM10010973_37700 [Cribrihabitans marinus]SEK06403.1 hypothetical protein SAMN05444007_11617 [Cribrihabitans marinus]
MRKILATAALCAFAAPALVSAQTAEEVVADTAVSTEEIAIGTVVLLGAAAAASGSGGGDGSTTTTTTTTGGS